MRDAIVTLLAMLALCCFCLELTTRAFYGRISHIRARIESERRAALSSGNSSQARPEVLVAGNSLLLHGVNYPALQQSLASSAKVSRFVVESTGYLDWYYGLRQIFQHGGRPKAVVLLLSPGQFLAPRIAGDLTANVMVDHRDVFRFTRETQADRTTTTNLLLDNVSDFYGGRAEIRNWILHMVMPNSEQLGDFLRPHAPPLKEDDDALNLATVRLRDMRLLCENYGAQFVLAAPPQLSWEGIAVLKRAAEQAQVPYWVPVSPGDLPPSKFSDGQHLTEGGAAVFTPALAGEISHLDLASPIRARNSQQRFPSPASMQQ